MTGKVMRDASVANVLVTGGAGFIGSHIIEALHALGWRTHVLDSLVTGNASNVPEGVTLHEGDIRSADTVGSVMQASQADIVVHCAAQTSVERSMKDAALDRDVNVSGTQVLLAAARSAGVRRFVFISSGGAIYGETLEPATERTPPSPRSSYGTHKYLAEQSVNTAGISFAILRPSNVYGPRQRSDAEGGVLAIFSERVLAGLPIEIHGDGRQVRDFVYVSDVVEAVRLAISHNQDVIWNVSSGAGTAVIDAARRVGEHLGSEPTLVFCPPRAGDINQSLMTPALISSTGAWGPPLSLDDGLRRLAAKPAPAIRS